MIVHALNSSTLEVRAEVRQMRVDLWELSPRVFENILCISCDDSRIHLPLEGS